MVIVRDMDREEYTVTTGSSWGLDLITAQGLLVHPTGYWRVVLGLFKDCALSGIGGLQIYY